MSIPLSKKLILTDVTIKQKIKLKNMFQI